MRLRIRLSLQLYMTCTLKKIVEQFHNFYSGRTEDLALVSSFDEKKEANPVLNFGVQSIAFKVRL